MAQLTLHTERLRLVPLADEHLQFEIELDSDPEVMRYITGRALSPDEVEQAHRRRLAAADEVPGLGFWAGFADDEFIGWWILQPPNGPDQPRVAGEADLGYRVLRRHWRRGYASEGARELIRYGFEDVCLDRIFAQTMAVNAASRATMAAVGLTFTRAFVSGEPYDDLVPGAEQGEVEYEVTRTTWQHSLRVSDQRSRRFPIACCSSPTIRKVCGPAPAATHDCSQKRRSRNAGDTDQGALGVREVTDDKAIRRGGWTHDPCASEAPRLAGAQPRRSELQRRRRRGSCSWVYPPRHPGCPSHLST